MKQIHLNLNNDIKNQLLADFKDYLDNTRLSNTQITFSRSINNYIKPQDVPVIKQNLIFSKDAYLQMLLYVTSSSEEIAWHGTVRKENNNYYIDNVFLYPQTVTAATVNTDQEAYNDWLTQLDDDTFNNLRFQGHSHVNMAVNPSTVDMNYYKDMLSVLNDDDFYIFIILNKRNEMTALIYDLAKNTYYETEDINIIVLDNNINLLQTTKTEKEFYITKPTVTYPSNYSGSTTSKRWQDEDDEWYNNYYDRMYGDIGKVPKKTTKGRKK